MEQFRIEVGLQHGVEPRNIVGAIANEAGLDAEHIGHIEISTEFSLVELPIGMPKDVFKDLKKVWVCGKQLQISRIGDNASKPREKRAPKPSSRTGNPGGERTKERKKGKSGSKPRPTSKRRAGTDFGKDPKKRKKKQSSGDA
jgi:ATP-dependent RNA helicase DeaD